MNKWNDPKLVLSLGLIGLFAWAYGINPNDESLKGAIITAFAAAYGYHLGSSAGSQRKTDAMADHLRMMASDSTNKDDGE